MSLAFNPRQFTPDDILRANPTGTRERAWAQGWPQFCAWFDKVQEHHEFSEAAELLAKATERADRRVQVAYQWTILWNCWRAASWEPDPFFDERVCAADLMEECVRLIGNPTTSPVPGALSVMALYVERSGVAGQRFSEHITAAELRELRERLERATKALIAVPFLENAQHGPLLYRDTKARITQLPSVATILAAQLAWIAHREAFELSWRLIALLVGASGISETSEESLQVTARRVLDKVDEGKIGIVGWPADVGATHEEMQRWFATVQ